MPVTAKLSRRFYEQFGDEITNELVDWFNSVDATYRSDLRDLNEHNFARFDAKLEQRAAAIEARIDGLEAKMDARIDSLEAKMNVRFQLADARTDARIAELREALTDQLARFESRMMRWMFTMWTGTMLAMAGLLFAIIRK